MNVASFEITLQQLARENEVTLHVSENAMHGMRHQRIIRDATKNQSPQEVWECMRLQGAVPGTSLEFKVDEKIMDYCTTLYWKFIKS